MRREFFVCIVAAFATMVGPVQGLVADSGGKSNQIRVALYDDDGVTKKGLPKVERCLPHNAGFKVTRVSAADIRDGKLQEYEVLIMPGGSGSGQAKSLGDDGRNAVRKFVEQGGGFIGICAGSYLASANYPWSLGLIDARVVDSEHWARGNGEVQLRLAAAGREAFAHDQELCPILYYQGPLLAPGEKDEIPDYELLASFETEIAENGAPAGVMKGTTAIARGTFGKGRVVCFSPHPEKTKGRADFVQAAVRWAAGLASEVGEEITLRGRFDGPGKISDFIVTEFGQVYLKRKTYSKADSVEYGMRISATGKLQRHLSDPSNSARGERDSAVAKLPTHYYIEEAEVTPIR